MATPVARLVAGMLTLAMLGALHGCALFQSPEERAYREYRRYVERSMRERDQRQAEIRAQQLARQAEQIEAGTAAGTAGAAAESATGRPRGRPTMTIEPGPVAP